MTKVPCFGKLNLTLRLTGVLPSGYHELCSLFCKIGPIDTLTINTSLADNVRVIFNRAKSAPLGRNILFKAIEAARAERADVPFLDMTLEKNVPPGTGLGCGSGDAAALLSYLAAHDSAARVGADVPFLYSSSPLALAQGTGERITAVDGDLSALEALVVIPEWRCQTPEMYQKVDRFYGGVWPVSASDALAESAAVLKNLSAGVFCGLLPNDFTPVLLEEYPLYRELFSVFELEGAVAWGISGSGSAAFALRLRNASPFTPDLPWIEDVLNFSLER